VVALGADDQSVSVWQTKHARPLVVAREVFDRPIMDLAWYVRPPSMIVLDFPMLGPLLPNSAPLSHTSPYLPPRTCRSWDGLTLYACSSDGTVALFDFDEHELEGIVPHSVQGEYLKKFGFEARNAEIRMEQQREKEAFEKAQHLQQQQSVGATNGTAAATSNTPGQQQVTITKDGRRRIKPNLIGHLSSSGSALLAPAAPIPTSIPTSLPVAPSTIPTPSSASANVSMAEAFATAPMLPFAGGDADGDIDMSVPIDAWGANGSSSTKANIKARTLGGDRKREPTGPIRELRGVTGEEGAIVAGARVLEVPSIKSSLSCRVEGSEKDAESVEVRNSEEGESQFGASR
jgi:protein HIRA/HIR1